MTCCMYPIISDIYACVTHFEYLLVQTEITKFLFVEIVVNFIEPHMCICFYLSTIHKLSYKTLLRSICPYIQSIGMKLREKQTTVLFRTLFKSWNCDASYLFVYVCDTLIWHSCHSWSIQTISYRYLVNSFILLFVIYSPLFVIHSPLFVMHLGLFSVIWVCLCLSVLHSHSFMSVCTTFIACISPAIKYVLSHEHYEWAWITTRMLWEHVKSTMNSARIRTAIWISKNILNSKIHLFPLHKLLKIIQTMYESKLEWVGMSPWINKNEHKFQNWCCICTAHLQMCEQGINRNAFLIMCIRYIINDE